jgi:hypothetical protein
MYYTFFIFLLSLPIFAAASTVIIPIDIKSITPLTVPAYTADTARQITQMKRLAAAVATQSRNVRSNYSPTDGERLSVRRLILPAGMTALGIFASKSDRYRDIFPVVRTNPHDRRTPFDDVAQVIIAPSLFLFDLLGEEKNSPADQFFITLLSYGIMTIPVRLVKYYYDSPRPYGGDNSFPSGHTAAAFVGSHMIYREFQHSSGAIAYSGYAMGTLVACMRVVHDKHWVSDVLAGAGIAILATELAYHLYFPVKRKLFPDKTGKRTDNSIALFPFIQAHTVGFNFSLSF